MNTLLRIILTPIAIPVSAFFRWLGCPLEGGCAIDLDDPSEWMTAEEWARGPQQPENQ
jgi:hypothetical protein